MILREITIVIAQVSLVHRSVLQLIDKINGRKNCVTVFL